MSLPLQYQREIIQELITNFPILVFKNSNSKIKDGYICGGYHEI